MEFEQIIKRLDFLDKQQRENKELLVALVERLNSFESSVSVVSEQVKPLSKQIKEVTPVTKRVEQFETLITRQRNELVKMIEEKDKAHTRKENEIAKQHLPELLDAI